MTNQPAPAAVAVPPKYDWLVMMFLGGDNDLFEFGEELLSEAQRVGSSDRVAVVAQHDPTDPKKPTRSGQLFRGEWKWTSLGRTPGDAQTIVKFIQDSKKEFPAEKQLLILWDHGNGWQNVQVFDSVVDATNELRLQSIRAVVEYQPIGVLCFDSCLMAMIEIAYELRKRVQYIVASENVVPADSGWPYESILRTITIRPHIEAKDVVRAMVDGFSGSYNGSHQPIALSALALDHVEAAVEALEELSRELIVACVAGRRQQVAFARRYAQSFGNSDYIDIVSFCEKLQKQPLGAAVCDAAENVKTAVKNVVIGATHGTARSISGANGLSIYFPDRPISPLYDQLEFAKDCAWSTFIRMMVPNLVEPHEMVPPDLQPNHECVCGHTHAIST